MRALQFDDQLNSKAFLLAEDDFYIAFPYQVVNLSCLESTETLIINGDDFR